MAQLAPPRRPERLRSRGEFSEVMRSGRRARHRVLQLVARRTDAPVTCVGLSVGRPVGGAVVRNRVKRRLRMIVQGLPWQPGFDVVIVARSGAESESFSEIERAVVTSARRLELLSGEAA